MKHIAIFASGTGSNAENIIRFFSNKSDIKVSLVISNKEHAGVLDKAIALGTKAIFKPKSFLNTKNDLLTLLSEHQIDFIVLAGYLLLIPEFLIDAFPDKIINIHPALLPKHGGKGMYGMHVHRAVVDQKDSESGITIHYVNKNYDEGQTIFQAKCPVNKNDSAQDVANKIHELEMLHFPTVIQDIVRQL
ncbi:MAG: phosphoribosylglycinamide formyltransferase [Bacteroidales bacterium]|nr:phosphoribosylglycinamide formyltransferase [Bacteroidales bacterium]